METRVCSCCGVEYPATTEFFYADKTVKRDGLASKCKMCRLEQMDKYREVNRDDINKRARQAYAKDPQKTCNKTNKYKASHREDIKIKNQIYYRNNKDHYAEYGAEYRANNPEKVRERHKKYIEENAHKIKAYASAYLKTERGKIIKAVAGQRRRNLKKSLESDFTPEEWELCKSAFGGKCCYCGEEKTLTQEHFVPLSSGGEYTKNNIIPACESCNKSKQNRDFYEWYPRQPFYNKTREKKILKYLNYNNKIQQLSIC